MYLKAINLKGFKSFPDRTRLTFTPGVSVIVGPNGCGKSNITDAVLWALGEQRPNAVRGQSMQDVIFAGGKGHSPRRFAEVEVVIDNSEGRANTEFSEISVSRRIDRGGEGEYRLNGARCRLADVLEALADTNLGREMHSVISQGRVEAIVNSKPRERRMLIEEAAGLGKHRKRRHRAQLKLERTRENLDRALDVEREARTRLRPLKRQAEAAERHARLRRLEDELRARVVAADLRSQEELLAAAERTLSQARGRRDSLEQRLAEVRDRRRAVEERIAAGESARRRRDERLTEARTAVERLRVRAEAVALAERELDARLGERQLRLDELGGELEVDEGAGARVAELEAELEKLDRAGSAAVAAESRASAERAEARRVELEAELSRRHETVAQAVASTERAERARELARAEAEKAAERAAALGGELAAVEARLAGASSEGGGEALGALIEAAPGLELALSAALGERLRASVAASLAEAIRRLRATEGAARALLATRPRAASPASPPGDGARRLLDLIEVGEGAREVVERLLADAWLVDDLSELSDDFSGLGVTIEGECYDGSAGEVRRLPRGATDPALLARSQREELAARLQRREQTSERARRELERAGEVVASARAERVRAEGALREAQRQVDEAAEEARRAAWLADRRAESEAGGEALRRARLEAELEAERRHAEAAGRAREAHRRDRERLERRVALERHTLPALKAAGEALGAAAASVEAHSARLAKATPSEDGEGVAAELRECSRVEFGLQGELREAGEALTVAEVEGAQLRDRRDEGAAELRRIAGSLGEDLRPAERPLPEAERAEIEAKLSRLERRREQIGPVNPLAAREYGEARERLQELEEQRQDLERALGELRSLIRRTDREIATAFEETFEATSRNFEEMAAELFPGGRGRLRRIDLGPRPAPEAGSEDELDHDHEELTEGGGEHAAGGVEIEVTPAGKSMRRLSLLSGGEKSLVALAFVFAVLMARPCPFYILDEVEAALDDINLDRFLRLVRRFSERSQFVVVTHQKRTMDAADILYGVSMGGDGVTKIVSRKMPQDEPEPGEGEIRVRRGSPEPAEAA
jgi:chromosome segregation protein